jgi:glutamate-ammonia-ligase adenylyltransferase
MAALARIFGSGSYLWEEFVKMQHENLLPRLKQLDEIKGGKPKEEMVRELRAAVQAASAGDGGAPGGKEDDGAAVAALNRYKDAELFRIDLLYLIYPGRTFIQFSEELSDLAEAIISEASDMAFASLCARHGVPAFGGRPCGWSVLALGKLGGRELGYASDIELVLVYEGNEEGAQSSDRPSNSDFFASMVSDLSRRIKAKHRGIFEIDLRLRPHGESGPLAASFPRWREYYAPGPDGSGGEAHDYERQSLIKLRPICGSPELAARIMAERDALVFRADPVGLAGQLDLRQKQIKEKVKGGRINAKYSEGGLAELEYAVQFLQLRHGHAHPSLRVPNTLKALEGLLENGIVSPSEFETLYNGYAFLRRLINVLREVRGNAQDLALPEPGSDQYQYLARRLGYAPKPGKTPDVQLGEDIRRHLRHVSGFFRSRFLGEAAAADGVRGLPEAILPENPPGEESLAAVAALGLSDPAKGLRILRDVAVKARDRNALAAALVLAGPHIRKSPDPDQAVLHLGNFLMNCPDPDALVQQMVYYPRYLELLICIFGFSETLSDFLARRPDLIHTLADETYLAASKTAMQLRMEVEAEMAGAADLEARVEGVRFFKMKELLRIGLGEIFLDNPLSRTTKELSNLADAVVSTVYQLVLKEEGREDLADHQTVLALGKLGGQELNYSSDIDLVFVHAVPAGDAEGYAALERADKRLLRHLTDTGANGQLYRVDLKLRPYGGQGPITGSLGYHKDYYETKADGWELQAWLKARPVAGSLDMGRQLVKDVREILLRPENREKAFRSILKLRRMVLDRLATRSSITSEVKSGPGGIRTVEFLVQHEQIRHGREYPEIVGGHTLNAMAVLRKYDLMAPNLFRILRDGYIFLRRIENRIQLYGMQQRHTLPSQPAELAKLAKRMGYEDRLNVTALSQFLDQYRYHLFVLAEISGNFFDKGEAEGAA